MAQGYVGDVLGIFRVIRGYFGVAGWVVGWLVAGWLAGWLAAGRLAAGWLAGCWLLRDKKDMCVKAQTAKNKNGKTQISVDMKTPGKTHNFISTDIFGILLYCPGISGYENTG